VLMRLVMLSLVVLTGCVSAPRYEAAVSAHNMFRQVILTADQVFAPIYKTAAETALEAAPSDEAYRKAMMPYEAFATALIAARDAEVIAQKALVQCSSNPDGECDLARTAFACGRDALGALSQAGGQVTNMAVVFAVTYVAEQQLDRLAEGATCGQVKP
jgi:hypothetical protein